MRFSILTFALSISIVASSCAPEKPAETTKEGNSPPTMSSSPSSDSATASPERDNKESNSDSKEASTGDELTDDQKRRIGGALQRAIRGKKKGNDSVEPVAENGEKAVYEVIIVSDDADALRENGIPLNSVQGRIITARLTINQILEAAKVEAVKSIQAATQHQMHGDPPRER